ncbi:MBL fold metallo-hydrolase [Candidatus Parcubacteria bacterium]|nr:MBL fold metallo-hydrolase [Patescibacteria group bacterium]MBU4466528.1 MBL fold metallo-hydrolase [Patescibacteria group bacterium]MCG2688218.1 MBL fold metallo-hydrolase [Candidatus Parcubacteria bacterium]
MQIIWKGQSCFQIITSQGKDNQVSLVIDPFGPDCGLKVPNLTGDAVLITHSEQDARYIATRYNHPSHDNVKALLQQGEAFLINGPGEYEIKGVYIQGIPAFHDKNFGKPLSSTAGRVTIYTIESEGMRICHLSDFGQKELFPEQLEDIGEIDVLLIPVGGNETIGAEEAQKIIGQIEPKIVIPMHYSIPKLKAKLAGVDKFLKVMGEKNHEVLPKLTIKNKDLTSEDEMKIIVLHP